MSPLKKIYVCVCCKVVRKNEIEFGKNWYRQVKVKLGTGTDLHPQIL